MREFKKGKLNIGGSKKKVKNRKQAIAIALLEAGISKKQEKIMLKKPLQEKKEKVYASFLKLLETKWAL